MGESDSNDEESMDLGGPYFGIIRRKTTMKIPGRGSGKGEKRRHVGIEGL
jgi:hypothetical protein